MLLIYFLVKIKAKIIQNQHFWMFFLTENDTNNLKKLTLNSMDHNYVSMHPLICVFLPSISVFQRAEHLIWFKKFQNAKHLQ